MTEGCQLRQRRAVLGVGWAPRLALLSPVVLNVILLPLVFLSAYSRPSSCGGNTFNPLHSPLLIF